MWTQINGEPIKMIALAAGVALLFVIFLALFLIRLMGIHWARVVPPLVLVVILAAIGAILTIKPTLEPASVPGEARDCRSTIAGRQPVFPQRSWKRNRGSSQSNCPAPST